MIHPDDSRYDFAVVVRCYNETRASSWTQHYTLAGAIKSARSLIGGRKHRVRSIETCHIWEKRSNRLLTVDQAEKEED